MKTLLPLPCIIVSALLSLPVLDARADSASPIVGQVSYGGSGTPQGSVGTSFSNDRKSFTLIFDSFVASSGPGVPVTESQKNSSINIRVDGKGTGAQLLTADLRGYVQIPAGVTAELIWVLLDGKGRALDGNKATFDGAQSKDCLVTAESLLPASVWSSAKAGPLVLSVEISLHGDISQQAQITVDSIDSKLAKLDQ